MRGLRAGHPRRAAGACLGEHTGKTSQIAKDGLTLARRFRDHEDMILRTLLMAADHALRRELSRRIRDDLIQLGIVQEGGVQIWVLTLGGKLGREHATTQRIKVTLQPVNPDTGQDAQITDSSRGPGPAGPPP